MEDKNIILLNRIITYKSNELGIEVIKPDHSGSIVSMLREDWHLFIEINSPIVQPQPLLLQMTICVKEDTFQMLCFPSPGIITNNNTEQFIKLANIANLYLFRDSALGRLWVDDENFDFAYELIIKEELLENCTEEITRQLFDVPITHFKDLHIPLIMLANNEWDEKIAIKYLTELRENGCVGNKEYGLW